MSFSAVARRVVSAQGWGAVNSQKSIAQGATWFSCAGHGGVVADASRFSSVAQAAFERAGMTVDAGDVKVVVGEEDCGYACLFLADDLLREAANVKLGGEQSVEDVDAAVKNWNPDFYAAMTSRYPTAAESYIVRKREHEAANAGNYVSRAAYGAWHERVPEGMVGVAATRKSDGAEAYFLVPAAEYDKRDVFGFVVDADNHEMIEGRL